jgi:hypothetical protein
MKVSFERTGGFAGMHLACSLDSRLLPLEDRRQLEENLASAHFFDLPEKLASAPGGADHFQYRISVSRWWWRHSVELGESAVTDELQPLIEQLSLLARTAK